MLPPLFSVYGDKLVQFWWLAAHTK